MMKNIKKFIRVEERIHGKEFIGFIKILFYIIAISIALGLFLGLCPGLIETIRNEGKHFIYGVFILVLVTMLLACMSKYLLKTNNKYTIYMILTISLILSFFININSEISNFFNFINNFFKEEYLHQLLEIKTDMYGSFIAFLFLIIYVAKK